jgi:hypothetical protein|tara:strand:+ start:29 stop:400 length:372 start_codon:yes stop_codon:yes gene_type:complete
MSKYKTNFKASKVFNSKHLDTIVKSNVEGKTTSYYLITNSWDGVCNYFNERLPNDGVTDLNVVDIFNVPNALDVIRSSIKSHRETISTACLSRYTQLPMLVVIHKSFPRVVSYNGSVGAEIGV